MATVDTSRDPSLLHPLLQERWEYMKARWKYRYPDDPQPFLTATYRGPIDQQKHLDTGATKVPFGQSLHNYKPAYAMDISFARPGGKADYTFDLYRRMAQIAKPLGLEWGGDWAGLVDGPHFQLPTTWQGARDGVAPNLPPVPGSVDDVGALIVVTKDGVIQHAFSFDPATHNVVTRYAENASPDGGSRLWIDIRRRT